MVTSSSQLHKTLNLMKITESGHIYSYAQFNFEEGLFCHIFSCPVRGWDNSIPTYSLTTWR